MAKVVVTGGTRGIGFAIASLFIEQGHDVAITGTTPEGKMPEGCSELIVADFKNTSDLVNCFNRVSIISPDVLVNNAGINYIGPFDQIPLCEFQAVQKVNVEAPFFLTQAALPGMKERKWGSIVNIASIWGNISKAHRGPYSTSKFALDGMTAALAAEVAQYGVLANCISPGFIDTDLTRSVLSEEQINEIVSSVPMKRLGTPKEIAKLVVWLSIENTFISGQNIVIDGGFTRV